MNWKIPLADLNFDAAEETAVLNILRSQWLTMGQVTQQFEAEFAAFTGAKHALAVTNCTAALHMAGLALGWQAGDEVIVPSLTFVATANAVGYTGATPVFADIRGEQDFSIDPDAIAAQITPRTRAIIVVHYGGYACDMPRILALAEQHGLAVVEDAAHAPGSELNGRYLGTWGDIGCFSFFSNKNMTTGEGGMVTTNDDSLAEKLRLMRSHGMTSLTWDRHKGHSFNYDVVAQGYNYRIDEIRSALGRVQLQKLPGGNGRRQMLNNHYVECLQELLPQIVIPYEQHPGTSACHIRPILLPNGTNRHDFMAKMKAQGIQTSIHYPPVHTFSQYRNKKSNGELSRTTAVSQREVTLPLYPGMSKQDVEIVVRSIHKALIR